MFRRIFNTLIGFLVITSISIAALSWFVMNSKIEVPILAIVTKDSYPKIPAAVAKKFLLIGDFDPNSNTSSGMPAYNFVVAGYGLSESWKNKSIIELSQMFIDKGADINRSWHGYTPLLSAVLSGEHLLVKHLLKNKANIDIMVDNQSSPTHNMTALQLAEYLGQKQDMSEIINMLENET